MYTRIDEEEFKMIFLKTLLVTFIVAGVLDLLTKVTENRRKTLQRFVVKPPLNFAFLGVIGSCLSIGTIWFCEHENTDIPISVMLILIVVIIAPSLLLMIAPIKGIWEIIVDNNEITVVKGFVYRRHWNFSSITYGKASRGGVKIYMEGKKRKAFFVDGMCEGSSNFIERMEKEGKKIIYPETKE